MKAVRLPKDLAHELKKYSQQENLTESEIIREALTAYLASKANKSPYRIGAHLFGKVGSSDGDLSISYKNKLKAKIREKTSR